jgi:hypothetical protein
MVLIPDSMGPDREQTNISPVAAPVQGAEVAATPIVTSASRTVGEKSTWAGWSHGYFPVRGVGSRAGAVGA